jgi:hypothetical protein
MSAATQRGVDLGLNDDEIAFYDALAANNSDPAETRLPAGPTGRGDEDGPCAGGASLRRMGRVTGMAVSKPKSPLARWTPKLKELRALSLKQPWAWLVVNGYKDIENRSWRTTHRGPLLIHASRSNQLLTLDFKAEIKRAYGIELPNEVRVGGIIGVVDVVGCVKKHSSKWKFKGLWGWVLENPRRLSFRECKGFVGLFKPKL